MAARKYNFTIEEGATWSKTCRLTNTAKAPIDLTGNSFRGQIKSSATSDIVIMGITFAITGALNGTFNITIPTNEPTNSIFPSRCFYYVEWIKSNGDVVRLLQGTIRISPR